MKTFCFALLMTMTAFSYAEESRDGRGHSLTFAEDKMTHLVPKR